MRLLIIPFLFLGFLAAAQTGPADTVFVLAAEFGSSTVLTDSTFRVSSTHPSDQLGQAYLPTKIRVGYFLFDAYGRRYRVKAIVSANFGESQLDVVELQDNNIAPSGVGIVHRKPDDSDCIPEIPGGNTGLAPATLARIHNHNVANGCGGGGGSGTVLSIVAGTNTTVDNTDPANPIINVPSLNDADASITNEGQLGVGAGIPTSATITSNTSGANPISLEVGAGLSIAEVPGTNGGIITFTNTGVITEVDGSTTNEGALTVGAGGANTSTIVSNTSGSTPVTISGGTNVTVTESGSTITIAAAGGGGSDPIYTGTLTGGISTTIALYGFAPVYSTSGGVVTAANTTLNTTLHQYYVQGTTGNIVLLGAGTKQVTATFAYTAGTTYYLNDAGGLSTSADNDGDAIDYDSAVVYCIASLGANSYLINLKEPRHFVNN